MAWDNDYGNWKPPKKPAEYPEWWPKPENLPARWRSNAALPPAPKRNLWENIWTDLTARRGDVSSTGEKVGTGPGLAQGWSDFEASYRQKMAQNDEEFRREMQEAFQTGRMPSLKYAPQFLATAGVDAGIGLGGLGKVPKGAKIPKKAPAPEPAIKQPVAEALNTTTAATESAAAKGAVEPTVPAGQGIDRSGMVFEPHAIRESLPTKLRSLVDRFGIGLKDVRAGKLPGGIPGIAVPNRGRVDLVHGMKDMDIVGHEVGHILDNDLGIAKRLAGESDDVLLELRQQLRLAGDPEFTSVGGFLRKQLQAGDVNNMAGEAVAEAIGEWALSPTEFARKYPGLGKFFEDVLGGAPEPAVKPPVSEGVNTAPEVNAAVNKPTTPEPAGAVTPPAASGAQVPPIEPPKPPTSTAPVPPEPDFAGNIRLEKYPEELRPLLKEWADANPEAVQQARRGTRSDAQVAEDARILIEESGGNLKRWKPGQARNAEEVLALRGVLRQKTEGVLQAQKAVSESNSTQNLLNLELALREQALVQESVSGVTAEAGRALRQFRQSVLEASSDTAKMERLLKAVGGRDRVEDVAKLIGTLDMNDPVAVNQFIRSLRKPGVWDYINEIYINSILSGPKTHIVNSLSNTLNALGSPIERAVSAVVDIPLSAVSGRARARFFSEVPADAFGAVQGLKDGFRSFGYTMKHGISLEEASKYELARTRAITGKKGRIINAPSTTLEAADALMKQVNYRAAFNATAKRMIARKGLKGQEAVEALADLMSNPPKGLLDESRRIAEYRLYRQEPGTATAAIMGLREKVGIGGFKPLRYIVPFVRTPANLLKYGLERSPAGWLNPKLWQNIAAKNPEAADQIGRAVIGSITAAAIASYVMEDRITGAAPTNAAERDRFYRMGKQPFSIKIGDRWVSYQRIEPFNQTFGVVAAAVEALKAKDKDAAGKVNQAVGTISQNLVSQTYLTGLSDAIDVVTQPERYAGNIANRFATALLTPMSSLSRTVAQTIDRTVRQPETTVQSFEANIPGLSQNVPAKTNVFGEDIVRQSPAWSPINVTPATPSPLDAELDRLQYNIGFSGGSIQGVKLNPEETKEWQRISGQAVQEALTDILTRSTYWRWNDQERLRQIERAVNQAREVAGNNYLRWIVGPAEVERRRAEAAQKKISALPPKERTDMLLASPLYQAMPYTQRRETLRQLVRLG